MGNSTSNNSAVDTQNSGSKEQPFSDLHSSMMSSSEISDKKLNLECAYSTSISAKEYFNRYQSEIMANESFSYIFKKIMENLLPQIKNKDNILDIGTGPASFVVHYGKLFKNIVTIEPNPHFYET